MEQIWTDISAQIAWLVLASLRLGDIWPGAVFWAVTLSFVVFSGSELMGFGAAAFAIGYASGMPLLVT